MTGTCNLDILRTFTHMLHSLHQIKGQLILRSSHKYLELKVVGSKDTQGLRLDALEIDDDYVCTQLISPRLLPVNLIGLAFTFICPATCTRLVVHDRTTFDGPLLADFTRSLRMPGGEFAPERT
jgi:hypothetical protein